MAKTKRKAIILFTFGLVLMIASSAAAIFFLLPEEEVGPFPQIKEPLQNPLTGKIVEELPDRPIILSTDNQSGARPQSGLSKADIVYEFPVEGMLSRLEPIYYSQTPKKMGPARSARPYFIDMAREYKAVFCHHGWSPQARRYLQKNIIPYVSAFSYPELFFRTADHFAPHNSYTSGKDIRELMKKKGWDNKEDPRKFQFLNFGETHSGDPATNIDLNYTFVKNNYKYDQSAGNYKRFVDGNKCIDLETGKQITIKNILVQRVKSKVLDAKGRLKINMTKGGEALLFTDGMVINGSWTRENLDSPTIFLDENGDEFKLNVGNTWIQVLDQACEVKYK